MVLADPFSQQKPPSESDSALRLASVGERLLAFLIDFLIFSPVIGLCASGSLREIRTYLILDPESPEATITWILFLISIFVMTALLETCFVYFMQATPGQKFMQLRVRSYPEEGPLGFLQVLSRSILWCVSVPLAIPLLGAYTNSKRRTFHDRGSDTLIETLKSEGDLGPLPIEKKFFESWQSVMLIFVGIAVIASLWKTHSLVVAGHFTKIDLDTRGLLCEEIEPSLMGLRRLDYAVAGFFAGEISQECLGREADFSLWNLDESEKSFALLAKSLSLPEDSEDIATYRRKICEIEAEGEACAAALFLNSQDKERGGLLRRRGLETMTSRVLLLQDTVEKGQTASAAGLIRDLRKQKVFKALLDRQEVRNVWGLVASPPTKSGRAPASAESQEILEAFKKRYELE